MRLTGSAPVTWPGRASVDRWWAARVTETTEAEVDEDGFVRDPEAGPRDPSWRLVSGTHLVPGSTYALEGVGLDAMEVVVEVGGASGRRTARLAVSRRRRVLARGPVVEGVVDGLDSFERADVTSTSPYLRGTAAITPDPHAPLELELRLRWLQVHLHAEAVDDVLTATLEVSSRGVWSLVTAPVLGVLGRVGRNEMQDVVEGWAGDLSAVADGREPPAPARDRVGQQRREAARWSRDQLRERLERTQDQLEGAGWWATSTSRWLAAYDALPPAAWPTAPALDGGDDTDYGRLARSAAQKVAAAPRDQRRREIHDAVEGFARSDLRSDAATGAAPPGRPLTDADLELRWLRSPLSTYRHLRSLGTPAGDAKITGAPGAAKSRDGASGPYH